MSAVVGAASTEDIPLLARLHQEKVLNTEGGRLLYGQISAEDHVSWLEDVLHWALDNQQHVIAAKVEDRLVGFSVWIETESISCFLPELLKFLPRGLDQEIAHSLLTSHMPHSGLLLLMQAVETYEGAGEALLKFAFSLAVHNDLALYLFSARDSESFYTARGFVALGPEMEEIALQKLMFHSSIALEVLSENRGTWKDLPTTITHATRHDVPYISRLIITFYIVREAQYMYGNSSNKEEDMLKNAVKSMTWLYELSQQKHGILLVAKKGSVYLGAIFFKLSSYADDIKPQIWKIMKTIVDWDIAQEYFLHAFLVFRPTAVNAIYPLVDSRRYDDMGAGVALIDYCLAYADREKIEVHLEVTPAVLDLFISKGFKRYGPMIRSDIQTDYEILPLIRRPALNIQVWDDGWAGCPVILSVPTEDELPALAQIKLSSLKDSVFAKTLGTFQDSDLIQHEVDKLKGILSTLGTEWRIIMVYKGNVILGYSIWKTPTTVFPEIRGVKIKQEWPFPPGTNVPMGHKIIRRIESVKRSIRAPFWILQSIYVEPKSQHLGLGTMMVNWGAKQADAMGYTIHAATTDEVIPLLKRTGFVHYASKLNVGNMDELTIYFMSRHARAVFSPAEPGDVPELTRIDLNCLATPDLYRDFYPKLETTPQVELDGLRFLKLVTDFPNIKVIKCIRDGKIVGFSVWDVVPGENEGLRGEDDNSLEEHLDSLDPRANVQAIPNWRWAARKLDRKYNTEPHWYLYWFAVDPIVQSTGIGKNMVQWGLKEAFKENRRVTVTATPLCRKMFEGLGFQMMSPSLIKDTIQGYYMQSPAQPVFEEI